MKRVCSWRQRVTQAVYTFSIKTCLKMLLAKLPLKQLQVIWNSVINNIIHQRWSGKCYCLLPKYLYFTCTWLKKYLVYLMSSKYSEYLNLYLYLQIWKSTCTWLKYFEKYLTPTLLDTEEGGGWWGPSFPNPRCSTAVSSCSKEPGSQHWFR